jgi:hypothetical protein
LILEPLVLVRDAVVVISPGSIVHAIRHFILRSAHAAGLLESMAKRFRETQWKFVKDNMRLLSLEPLNCDPPSGCVGPPIEEALFMIDSDKAAFVQLLTDDLRDFDCDQPCGTWNHDDLEKRAQERADVVVEWLTGAGHSYCKNVLVMYVLASIGRDIVFGVSGEAPNSRTIVLSAQDIEIITQLRECDNLTLWKFTEADSRLRQQREILSFDFLDLYSVYKAHQESFYLSDDPIAPVMIVPVGEARGLRIKAARKADVHFVRRFGPADAIVVTRFEDDEAIPIYYPESGMGRTLDQLVEGYAQPVWIESLDRSSETLAVNWSLLSKITNMLSYWLWQIMPSLKAHLNPLGILPIRIRFSVADPELWTETELPDGSDDPITPACQVVINRRIVIFGMPHEIKQLLHAADNKGERVILRDLLSGFGEMLLHHGLPNTLHPAEIQAIIDVHAPLGRKKKLVLIQTGTRPSLNPEKLPSFRKLQSHDLEEQLDGIANELKPRSVGELTEARDCMSVCGELVDVYLRRIKDTLRQFHWESLLIAFIGQHEAYWHDRAINEITIPTNIQCYDNMIPQLQRFISDRVNAEHLVVALRILVEIVAAELPAGNQRVNTNDLDRLLAMAYHLVNWATLSDNIALGILDYRLSVLASGRIGVEKTGPKEIWDPFITAKSVEDVETAIREFDSRFVTRAFGEERPFDSSGFDPAFKAEFGLTLSEIGAFHRFFTSLGFAQRSPVVSVPIRELRDSISRDLGWHDSKIETALDLFSLKSRNKWEEAPPGFTDREDIWPWRYSRRLSYLRRPLIQVPFGEKGSVIFWGPRHVEEALRNLFGLVYTGRYKLQPESSEEMEKLISSLREKASEIFVTEVKAWIEQHSSWTCHREVKIGPGEALEAPEDIGDVDVLCLDEAHRRILSIECKNVNHARNPREIRNELERFLGDKDPADSWVGKHQKRHQWLEQNLAAVGATFALMEIPLQVKSLVLTSEGIPSAYVREIPLPLFSFSYLQREGIQALAK